MASSVLIIHSNPNSAEQFLVAIAELGLQTFTSDSPETGSQSIRINRPDLVLLDGDMVLSDISLCRKLRLSSPEKKLPIILLIPEGPEAVGRYLCGTEADDYICQPYSISEFEARLMLRLSDAQKSMPRKMPQIDFPFLSSLTSLAISDLSSTEILQQVVNSVTKVISVNRCSVTMSQDEDDLVYVMASSDDPGINGLQVERIGVADTFVEHGPQQLLRSLYGIDAAAIVRAAVRMMGREGS